MAHFFEQNSLRKGCGLGELNCFHNDVAWFFYHLMIQSASWAEDYFKVWEVLGVKIKFVVAAYTFNFQVFHLNSTWTDNFILAIWVLWSNSKGSSNKICFFRIVINSILQIGQWTYWYSSTKSNSKFSLHSGHVKITEALIFCISFSPIIIGAFVNLRNILVDCSNYIEDDSL